VGGSCRLPFIEERIVRAFGRPVERRVDYELAVCLGAAEWIEQVAAPVAPSVEEPSAAKADAEAPERAAARKAAALRVAKREAEKRKRASGGRLKRNVATIAATGLFSAQHEAVMSFLTDTEKLLWLFRCKRPSDTLRQVAAVITTEQLIWCRATGFSLLKGVVPWGDVSSVRDLLSGFSLEGPNVPSMPDGLLPAFDGIKDGHGIDLRGGGFAVFTRDAVMADIKRLVYEAN
jgi:hypothetical protein